MKDSKRCPHCQAYVSTSWALDWCPRCVRSLPASYVNAPHTRQVAPRLKIAVRKTGDA